MSNNIMDKKNRLVNPLLAYNKRRKLLIILNGTNPCEIFFESESNVKNYTRTVNLGFKATFVLALDDFLVIQGEDAVAAYCLDTGNFYPVGQSGRKIYEVCVHPLSNRAIGILSNNGCLAVYTLPNSEPDRVFNLLRISPVSFTFFVENPKNLFALGACVLTSSGELYTISPVLPINFKVNKSLLNFKQIIKFKGNSYILHEKKLPEWLASIESSISPNSKWRNKLSILNYSFDSPVPRGPCYSQSESSSKLKVINDSNPSVLALVSKSKLKILIGTGDLIPSFSDTHPSIEWDVIEEIEVPRGHLLYVNKYLIYATENQLLKIDLPWLPQVKESYLLREPVKSLPKSVVSVLINNSSIVSACVFYRNLSETICLSSKSEVVFQGLNSARVSHGLGTVSVSDFCPAISAPQIPNAKVESIIQAVYSFPQYKDDNQELANLLEIFNSSLEKQVTPIYDKLSVLKSSFENIIGRHQKLKANYSIVEEKIKTVESIQEEFQRKIDMIAANDEKIRSRMMDIVEIQQNTKKPLTQAEMELSRKLTLLESDSNEIKSGFLRSLNELSAAQSKLRSISGAYKPDSQFSEELNLLSYQLGEVSSEISKFRQLTMLKND